MEYLVAVVLCSIVAIVAAKTQSVKVVVVVEPSVKGPSEELRARLRKMGGISPDDLSNLSSYRGLA